MSCWPSWRRSDYVGSEAMKSAPHHRYASAARARNMTLVRNLAQLGPAVEKPPLRTVNFGLLPQPLGSKDYEHRVQTSETMIDLAAIRLMRNRIALRLHEK